VGLYKKDREFFYFLFSVQTNIDVTIPIKLVVFLQPRSSAIHYADHKVGQDIKIL